MASVKCTYCGKYVEEQREPYAHVCYACFPPQESLPVIDPKDAEIARLKSELEAKDEEIDRLRAEKEEILGVLTEEATKHGITKGTLEQFRDQLREHEETEAACCPEDTAFSDYIDHLEAQLARLEKENEALKAELEAKDVENKHLKAALRPFARAVVDDGNLGYCYSEHRPVFMHDYVTAKRILEKYNG